MIRLAPQVVLHEVGESPPSGGLALPQVPSRAFGDGSHPTTRLCAGAVEFLCRTQKPENVLDVGTGTGVLARIARARGARFVIGTDIDPEALRAARENAALDSAEITISDAPPDQWGPRFNLVIANILEGPLSELSTRLVGALAPGGILLISGFTRLQVARLRLVFEDLEFVGESYLEDWALLQFRKSTF